MATEEDKTNTGVVLTALLVGAAAMLGGSAGLVALAKGEMQELGEQVSTNANLGAIKALREEQRAKLRSGKSPIEKAEATILAGLMKSPTAASPFTPPPAPEPAVAPSTELDGGAVAPQPSSGEVSPAPSAELAPAATTEATGAAPSASSAPTSAETAQPPATTPGLVIPPGGAAPSPVEAHEH